MPRGGGGGGYVRNDRHYKEVRRTIARNQRKKQENDEEVMEESYVDTYRSVAVQLGAAADLKSVISKSGMKNNILANATGALPGDPSDDMYLRQAEHLMKRSIYPAAVAYLDQALNINPASKIAQSTRARCLLMMGKWEDASKAADKVLNKDKNFVKALLVKAEALYNTCDFEHALVLFHRGQILAPDVEAFRLGIQKCRKTIQCTVSKDFVFHFEGVNALFAKLRRAVETISTLSSADIPSGHMGTSVGGAGANRGVRKGNSSAQLPVVTLEQVMEEGVGQQQQKDKRNKKKIAPPVERPEAPSTKKKSPAGVMTFEDSTSILMLENKLQQQQQTQQQQQMLQAKKAKKRNNQPDRLGQDKEYLSRLASDLLEESSADLRAKSVGRKVSTAANEALNFLEARDEFWKQVDLGAKVAAPTASSRLDFTTIPRSS